MPEKREFNESLERGLRVLVAFDAERHRMSIKEAASLCDLSPATARRALITLHELGYLSFDGRYYSPAPRMMRLGAGYLETTPLGSLAQPHLLAARETLNESVSVCVLEGSDVLFIARAEVRRILNTSIRVGTLLPAHNSAGGRILLASLPDKEVVERLAHYADDLTSAEVNALWEKLSEVRATGYSWTDNEVAVGVRTVSVPIYGHRGDVLAALTASSLSDRSSMEQMIEDFVPVLQFHSEKIGRMTYM